MGIALGAAKLLLSLKKKINFKGKILQIGKQSILFKKQDVKLLFPKKKIHYSNQIIDDIFFFKNLGFKYVDSLDASGYEGANLINDLNFPIKAKFKNSYNFIYDGGSLEHIFNVGQAMINLANMLKNKGIIMHFVPCNNYIDHGFYSFSPTLFKDFYSQNNFKLINLSLVLQPFSISGRWIEFEYNENLIKETKFSNKKLMIWAVFQKTNNKKKIFFPIQGKYINLYKKISLNEKAKTTDSKLKIFIKKRFPKYYFKLVAFKSRLKIKVSKKKINVINYL